MGGSEQPRAEATATGALSGAKGRGGGRRARKGNVALALGVFATLCVLAECSTRAVVYLTYGSATRGMNWDFTYEPYLMHRSDERLHARYPAKSSRLRVLVIGGSTAAQIPNEFLENSLGRVLARDVEVINFAQPGYISSQELIAFALYGVKVNPDFVVSVDGINDIVEMTKTGQVGMPYANGVISSAVNHPLANVFLTIGRHSQFINVLNKLGERRREIEYQSDTQLTEATVDGYIQNLNAITALAHGLGAPHMRILQPYMPLRVNLTSEEENSAAKYKYRFGYVDRVLNEMDARQATLPAGTAYSSTLHCFDTVEGRRFVDEAHLVTQGYVELSDCIAHAAEESLTSCASPEGPRMCLKRTTPGSADGRGAK